MSDTAIPKYEDTQEIAPPKYEDTHAIEANDSASGPSQLDSLKGGLVKGGTFGFNDELSGAMQALLNKAYGVAGQSPTDVNADLAKQGFHGDIGPTDSGQLYTQARDQQRQQDKTLEQANPKTFMAGEFAGGLPAGAALPIGAVSKLGPEATMLQKLLAASKGGAVGGAAFGGLTGLGNSEAQDVSGMAKDAAVGAAIGAPTGAVMGAGVPILGAGAEALSSIGKKGVDLAKKIIPENLQTAFKRGREGVDITHPDFYNSKANELNSVVDEIANPLHGEFQARANDKASQLEKLTNDKQALDNQVSSLDQQAKDISAKKTTEINDEMGKLEKTLKSQNDAQKDLLSAQNKQEAASLNKEVVAKAKETQEHLGKIREQLKDKYNTLDKDIEKTGVKPNTDQAIAGFEQELVNNSGLPDTQVESMMKKIRPFDEGGAGKTDMASYKLLKQSLSNLFDNVNPVVRRAAKQAYGKVNQGFVEALHQNGNTELADSMLDTNKKWSALSTIEDNFVSGTKPDRLTGQYLAQPDTINTISAFSEKNPLSIAKAEEFGKQLQVASPESKPLLNGIQDLNGKIKTNKDFSPNIPLDTSANPEMTRLQGLLDSYKQGKAPELAGLEQQKATALLNKQRLESQIGAKGAEPVMPEAGGLPVDNPDALKNQLVSTLPKYGLKSGNVGTDRKADQIFDLLKKVNPEAAERLQPKTKELAKDLDLRNQELKPKIDTPAAANQIGLATKKAQDVAKAATEKVHNVLSKPKDFVTQGSQVISKMTPDSLKALSKKGSETFGSSWDGYARVLDGIDQKTSVSRNAVIFSLMQQPDFREKMRKLMHQGDGTDGGQ